MIETLRKYNEVFYQNFSCGDEACEEVFEFVDRGSKLILSAPHATKSFVCKKEKIADLYTGALAQYVGEQNRVSTLIRRKYTPYKAMISDDVAKRGLQEHYFLDIHGFNKDVGYDICLGIADFAAEGYPYLEQILMAAQEYGLKVVVNHPDYCGRFGLTGRYHKAFGKPNVIQMEIKQCWRDFFAHSDLVQEITVPFLNRVVRAYEQGKGGLRC